MLKSLFTPDVNLFQYKDSFTQVITDPELEGLATHLQLKVADPVDQTIQFLNTAIRDNAAIVAYSEAALHFLTTADFTSKLRHYFST